ncbi:MAG: histidinol-phosphatase [Acidimicrobiia bacterium]|nr:histidinol-phosphatase [Acidimicrobiia bacterium]
MGDYHVHLHPHGEYTGSGPAPGTFPFDHIEAYVEAALGRGEDEVGFTEHLYRCTDAAEVMGEFWVGDDFEDLRAQTKDFVAIDRSMRLDDYVTAIVDAKDRGLPVLLGLEVDFFPETIEAVSDYLTQYPFDFLIGSTHWVGPWAVDHEDATWEFERRGVDQAYEDYFAVEAQLAASGAVDALAHSDVVKKFGHRPSGSISHLYRAVVDAAAESDTAVEVSSAGLYSAAKEPYPAPELLRMFYEAGVPITTASDGHFPEQCCRDFDVIKEYAKASGYAQRCRFRQRRRELIPL